MGRSIGSTEPFGFLGFSVREPIEVIYGCRSGRGFLANMLGEEFLREVIIARIATFQHLDKWASAGSIKQLFDPNEFHIAGDLLKIFELGDVRKCAFVVRKILPRAAKINP